MVEPSLRAALLRVAHWPVPFVSEVRVAQVEQERQAMPRIPRVTVVRPLAGSNGSRQNGF